MSKPLYKRWIVDKKGKRRYGTKESMEANLESNANDTLEYLRGERNPFNDIHAEFHAIHAAHWALALKGR